MSGRAEKGRRGDLRGPDQPGDRVAEDAPERKLLRLHRDAEEQDAGDLRRALRRLAARRSTALPHLHDEAGDRGAVHRRCACELHPGQQLLQAGQDGRGGPASSIRARRARSCALTSRATTTRSGSRRRSSSTTSTTRCWRQRKIGGQARAMVVTGGDPASDRVLPRDQATTWPSAGSRVEAIVAFSGEHEYAGKKVTRGFAQRISLEPDRRADSRGPVPAPGLRGQVPDRLRRAAAAHDVRRQDRSPASRRCRRSRVSTAPTRRSTTPSSSTSSTTRGTIEAAFADYYRTTILSEETDPNKLHDLQGAALHGRQVFGDGAGRRAGAAVPGWRRRGTSLTRSSMPAWLIYNEKLDEDGAGRVQGERQGVRAHLRLSWRDPAVRQRRVGGAVDLPQPADPEAACTEGGRPLARGSSRRSTWTAIGPRSVRRSRSRSRMRMPRSIRCRRTGRRQAGTGARPPLEHRQDLQRHVRGHRLGGRRPGCTAPWPSYRRKVAADPAYRNAMANSDRQNARIEHDQALNRAMQGLLRDNTELFKRFSDDPDFKRWLADMSFAESYDPQAVKDREAASEDD